MTSSASTLTVRQERFVPSIAVGNSRSAAYREAFNAGNMSANAIGVEACRLAQKPKIALKLAELKA